MVTSGVEFSFQDIMYKQIDGVAMGSPLGPVLANIFVGHCESLIPSSLYPEFYRRFVDDSLSHFPGVHQWPSGLFECVTSYEMLVSGSSPCCDRRFFFSSF